MKLSSLSFVFSVVFVLKLNVDSMCASCRLSDEDATQAIPYYGLLWQVPNRLNKANGDMALDVFPIGLLRFYCQVTVHS